ncbi:MAG TPA: restriction endonuclease [Candidatus Dormibacteraeota bacterium]|nr:restriction endonuclease [Candidatus Dormibacteraeota bacterium]
MALQVGQLRQSARSRLFRGTAAREEAQPATPSKAGAQPLEGLGWKDVERLVARLFHRDGFSVIPVSERLGPVDFIIERGAEKVFVQCRNWNVWEVSDRAVRELTGYMSGAGATRGFMLTTGQFTDEAHSHAATKGLELVDGARLPHLLAAA